MPDDTDDLTRVLNSGALSEEAAAERAFRQVYDKLRAIASNPRGSAGRPGDTLQPTALVHEAYMRLFRGGTMQWTNRAHFFGVAARATRHIAIKRLISRGGMGTVYLAVQANPNRDVALKVIDRGTDTNDGFSIESKAPTGPSNLHLPQRTRRPLAMLQVERGPHRRACRPQTPLPWHGPSRLGPLHPRGGGAIRTIAADLTRRTHIENLPRKPPRHRKSAGAVIIWQAQKTTAPPLGEVGRLLRGA